MPVRYSFSGRLIRVDLEGAYTPQDMMDAFTAALADLDDRRGGTTHGQ